MTICFSLGSPEPDPRHGFECKQFTWKVILENHGGGAHERDRAGEASSNMCVEKLAATVGIRSLILMGTLGVSVEQVPESFPGRPGSWSIYTPTLIGYWLMDVHV